MNTRQYSLLVAALTIIGYDIFIQSAQATIPDENGIFTGCVSKIGSLRLIDTAKGKCSRLEKMVTWSQGQNVPASGPFIVDAKGQLVGNLIQHTGGVAEGGIFVNYAGMPIDGDYYYVLVSEDGFENYSELPFPGKDGKICSWRYYESNDCTGNFFLMYSGASADPNIKYFSNYKNTRENFVYENKLYEYDASKVVWGKLGQEYKSAINECLDPNSWPLLFANRMTLSSLIN